MLFPKFCKDILSILLNKVQDENCRRMQYGQNKLVNGTGCFTQLIRRDFGPCRKQFSFFQTAFRMRFVVSEKRSAGGMRCSDLDGSVKKLLYSPALRRGWPRRLARFRTPAFHAGNRGSNPLGVILLRGMCISPLTNWAGFFDAHESWL